MSLYRDQILPRVLNFGMSGKAFAKLRQSVVKNARGRVLEIGFGSGLNLPHYGPDVQELLALDPATLGRKLAAKRLAQVSFPVEFVGLEGENIPLEDNSLDAVVSTWTLCTIPGVRQALQEIKRTLKPGGQFHFLEHGLSKDRKVARMQTRFNPIQKCIGGGCNLNRKIDELITDAGFKPGKVDKFYMPGAKILTFMYRGVALKN